MKSDKSCLIGPLGQVWFQVSRDDNRETSVRRSPKAGVSVIFGSVGNRILQDVLNLREGN